MKITMYELLGLVKDGKAPNKIKYNGQEYKITKILLEDNNYYFNYINEDMECIFPINTNHLDDEVVILEEEKKILEKLETYKEIDDEDCYANILKVSKNGECEIDEATSVIVDKINEIIDYLNSKGDK